MSLSNISQVELCDIRPMSTVTVDFKRCLFASYNYLELIDIFSGKKKFDLNRVVECMNVEGREIFKNILTDKECNLIYNLKKLSNSIEKVGGI